VTSQTLRIVEVAVKSAKSCIAHAKDAQTGLLVLAATPLAGYNFGVGTATPAIQVKVLFFGRLKEIVGRGEQSVECAEGAPIEELFRGLGVRYPELVRFRASLVASRNQEFAAWSTPLHSGDEVAFLPPVSGG
jgi:sulfur-carrier protein